MRKIILALIWLTLALPATAAYFTIQIGNITWSGSSGGYQCFNNTAYPNTINFTITKTVSGSHTYAVTAGTSATSGSYSRQLASGANRLNYQLYTSSTMSYVLQAPTTATANNVISGNATGGNGQVIPLSFILFVPTGQGVPPGTYTDTVIIGVYSTYTGGTLLTSKTITITVVVPATAVLSIVPTSGSFSSSTSQTLDFGQLANAQVKSCDLLIKKNTTCTVAFTSANLGVLKMIPTPTADQIPYSCKVNGTTLNLSSTANVKLPTGVSPAPDGTRLPVVVTMGDPSGATAGNYQDQITVTVTAP